MELLAAGVSRFFTASSPPHPDAKVWAKPLASPKGSIAVGLLNRPHATIRPTALAALACARTERCRCSQVALLNRADSAATNQSATITADAVAVDVQIPPPAGQGQTDSGIVYIGCEPPDGWVLTSPSEETADTQDTGEAGASS